MTDSQATTDSLREQARQRHLAGDTVEAIILLTQAIQQDPGNTLIAMDMVQIFIDSKELEQARSLFDRLPDNDKEGDIGKSLRGQLAFCEMAAKTQGKEALQARALTNPDDCDALFDLAICLVAEHDYPQAFDHLFDILRTDSEYKDGIAREMIINLVNMLEANDPSLAQATRRRLGAALA